MIPGKPYTAEDYLWMAWRRKWLVIVPFAAISVGTFICVQRLPNLYKSETVILVVPQRVPDTYVRSTVTSRIEDRLQSISPEILSRTRLEQIIEELDLYVEERKTLAMEEVVERMRLNIKADPIKETAFQVSYLSDDPVKAMEVTKRLASMFIDGNLRDRAGLAEGTNQFLESQLNDARARLIEQEKSLEAYRKLHAGELPSQVTSNLQSIQNSQMQVQSLGESISRDRDRVTMLERVLADAARDSQPVPVQTPSGLPDPLLSMTGSAADRLDAARRSLASLQTRFTQEHPDVIRMKRVIRDLEREAETEARQRAKKGDSMPPHLLTVAETANRARLRDTEIEIRTLRQRIAHQEAEQLRLKNVIAEYERRIEAAPTRESELAELTRDYDTLRSVYASLLTRREDSKIAANLERRQVGEQFKILDPPRLPEKPYSPNRAKLNAIGALLGLALGIGLAAFVEYRDTSLRTEDDVLTTLSLPVVAMIPLMLTKDEILTRRRRAVVGLAAGVLLAGAVATMVVWRAGIL